MSIINIYHERFPDWGVLIGIVKLEVRIRDLYLFLNLNVYLMIFIEQ